MYNNGRRISQMEDAGPLKGDEYFEVITQEAVNLPYRNHRLRLNSLLQFLVGRLNELDITEGNDGLSAYEIAVEQGFRGTVSEWLESLNGVPLDQGRNIDGGVLGIPLSHVITTTDLSGFTRS